MKEFNFGCALNKGNVYHAVVLVIEEDRFCNVVSRYYRMASGVLRFIRNECENATYNPDLDITQELVKIETAKRIIKANDNTLWLLP